MLLSFAQFEHEANPYNHHFEPRCSSASPLHTARFHPWITLLKAKKAVSAEQ